MYVGGVVDEKQGRLTIRRPMAYREKSFRHAEEFLFF